MPQGQPVIDRPQSTVTLTGEPMVGPPAGGHSALSLGGTVAAGRGVRADAAADGGVLRQVSIGMPGG